MDYKSTAPRGKGVGVTPSNFHREIYLIHYLDLLLKLGKTKSFADKNCRSGEEVAKIDLYDKLHAEHEGAEFVQCHLSLLT